MPPAARWPASLDGEGELVAPVAEPVPEDEELPLVELPEPLALDEDADADPDWLIVSMR